MKSFKKKNIVVVCTDKEYLTSIEYKLTEAFGGRADFLYFSEYSFLQEYSKQPRDIDILLIQQELYREDARKLNCHQVYMLIDEEKTFYALEQQGVKNIIYKYSSIRSMVDKFDSRLLYDEGSIQGQFKTQVVSVFSPSGGCGKTITALGVALQLARRGRKVLFLSTELLMDYKNLMDAEEYMPDQIGYKCSVNIDEAVESMLGYVQKREFEYLPPFKRILPAYHMSFKHMIEVVRKIREKNIYDNIVVEHSSEINSEKLNFLNESEKVVYVVKQDRHSVYKLKQFMDSIVECEGQWVTVCNFFDKEQVNYLAENNFETKYSVCEYIDIYEHFCLDKILQFDLLSKTAFAIS